MKRLLATAPEDRLREVERRHSQLDARLRELGKHVYLTPKEQTEVVQIKKLKLAAKDEMSTLRKTRPLG